MPDSWSHRQASHRQPAEVQSASKYKPISRPSVPLNGYPADSPAFVASLHDLRYYQGVLSDPGNFSTETSCDIFEVQDQQARWIPSKEYQTDAYFENLSSPKHAGSAVFRVVFAYLERVDNATWGCRVSLTAKHTSNMLSVLNVSPQFLPSLLGKPDYASPGDFLTHDQIGNVQQHEYFCQHPRWDVQKRTPMSIYMAHAPSNKRTTYIISCGKDHSQLPSIKARLQDVLTLVPAARVADPFMLHALIAHEIYLESDTVVTRLRRKLYNTLDRVDRYAESFSGVKQDQDLHDLTVELNFVSLDVDSMVASADMASMLIRGLEESHRRYEETIQSPASKDALAKTRDSLQYLSWTIEAQKRWLVSYKTRKDSAMNLVFNLVTQHNSTTSTTIATEAKADGTSMRVIAALTMVFLPGTFLSSVFGMSMLDDAKWWLYVALTLPLTVLVIIAWWLWSEFPTILLRLKLAWRRRKTTHTTA